MISTETALFAFLGGILPAMIWLYFLLKEDSRCPEPKTMILLAVIAGAIAVPIVLPLERLAILALPAGVPVILAWAAIEETVKYGLAALVVLWRKSVNESVDMVIYMLTVALGFAALENMLFLIAPFSGGNIMEGLLTGNLRFVGSTLLHVIASSTIGFAMAFSFMKPRWIRTIFTSIGLILAIALHALFNLLIIDGNGSSTLFAFFVVWSGAVVFFALFELLKYIRYHRLPKNTC
ncbi:PrsW family intramembrane metalloprotease [Patescibacteria group bacterium]|nr:PrsW family intramembrane metalloprotease [Patescibacteria group bacterium]MBU1500761.1 PrsW family intramembrane metalloprotease [Patescibacteria group bacterium]MBU2080816.1 PrsW family intramembrane metalloprotease [Patescibacteria group bacterium]MBU2123921.1 PrsW family intramembrane metalloprotease [Patescibacteria group bacterium]MBU2194788.1 PrsW family intramembrane metalloprotease [Patescibacteria group bacterium]